MKPYHIPTVLVFLLLVACTGCDVARLDDEAELLGECQDDPIEALIRDLRALGATVECSGTVSHPFFSVEGQRLEVEGQRMVSCRCGVEVFAYAEAGTANAEVKRVSPDGVSFRTNDTAWMVNWIATPHFFKKDRLIVLYVGESEMVIELFERVLCPQFAGQ